MLLLLAAISAISALIIAERKETNKQEKAIRNLQQTLAIAKRVDDGLRRNRYGEYRYR